VRHLIDRDVDVKYVDCGEDYTVVISKTGVCYSWGNSNNGRLGLAPPSGQQLLTHVLIPQEIESLRKYIIDSVSCGANHSLFVTGNGQLFATGCNIYGQVLY
jgi:alpha-tubulin suppressor-like RCC1 family protein